MLLSIVVPCYNEEEALPLFYREASRVAEQLAESKEHPLQVEYVFVDDGSSDDTLAVMKTLRNEDEQVHYISFSCNFGKEAAMYAGLVAAKGDLIVVMDADLQDPPTLLPKMVSGILDEGYDCIGTRRVNRKGEPPIRSWFARMFYKVINMISNTHLMDGVRDYRLMTRQMLDSILRLCEKNRFSKGLFAWVGYKTKWLEYENVERVAGESKWSIWDLFTYAFEGIFSFSAVPLAISSFVGLFFCVIALVMTLFFAIKAIVFGDPVTGFPTLVCIILLASGLQLFCLGIMGQYLSKAYLELKDRPIYITKEEA